MQVQKTNGNSEVFTVEKIHKVLEWATSGINGVSFSDIEMNANLSIYDGITTREIHQVLIKSANDLISEAAPNYQYVAARLLNMQLRKTVWGNVQSPDFLFFLQKNVDNAIYDVDILTKWDNESIKRLGKYINHTRDDFFTYAGLQQLIDKYLVRNRNTGEIYETPQFAYMCIAMCLFDTEQEVKNAYDCYSTFKINLPTPIMAGVRTNIKQFASCVLVDVGDDLDSIFSSIHAVGKYTAKRAGIGINIGRIRPINSPIRGGEVLHTGLIPYLKNFESAVKSTSQNGLRGGSATVAVPFFHYEIEDILVLKNNAGTDDNRVRKLDYSIQFCKLFYDRLIANEDITLFSPQEATGLYEAFGDNKKFNELYLKYEKSETLLFKKRIPARKLAETFARERLETGRIYSMNIDTANEHGSWATPVYMSNLCVAGDTSVTIDINGNIYTTTIEDAIEAYLFGGGLNVNILSCDMESGLERFAPITDAAMISESAEILEIYDEDSDLWIECTPDHKVFTINRGFVMAKDLEESDILKTLIKEEDAENNEEN